MKTAKSQIPDFAKPALWSYDLSVLDLKKHKKLIIKNVLDYGTKETTDWLQSVYSEEEIKEVLQNTPESAWNKKSLRLWSLVFGVKPRKKHRFD